MMSTPLRAGHARLRLPTWRVTLAALVAIGALAWLWLGAEPASAAARSTLAVFVLATLGWTVLRWPDASVAVAAAAALVALDVVPPARLLSALGSELVWLLIGAFILAAVLQASGLAQRYALRALRGVRSMRGLFYRLAGVIALTALVVPSTAGRAALLLPVFLVVAGALAQPGLTRALALLFPTIILLTACASLLGAGAHLVAVDVIARLGLPAPGFAAWAALGVPVALATAVAATELVLRLFLTSTERAAVPVLPPVPAQPLDPAQRRVAAIVVLTLAGWASGSVHGIEPAIVACGGALLATVRPWTGVGLPQTLREVEWRLVVFVAAMLVIGAALLSSGAAQWAAEAALRSVPSSLRAQPVWLASAVTLTAMLAHMVIASRSARVAILIPTVALPLALAPAQAAALILLVTIGSGFCQTLRAGAKPLMLYASAGAQAAHFDDADLLRLAAALMPVFMAVLVVCALWLWPLVGFDVGAVPG
jgi:solute carrier family 13 (sodium-dependent dicarboxylate transporter), member 2/3/5